MDRTPETPLDTSLLDQIDPHAGGLEAELALALAEDHTVSLDDLVERAGAVRDQRHPQLITYSPKVFIPLTLSLIHI